MTQGAALALTLLIEASVVAGLVGVAGWRPPGWPRWLGAALCVSLLTHPLAWWAHGVLPLPLWPRALLVEAVVICAEAGLYRALVPTSTPRALLVAAAANGASFGAGVWLTA